MDASLWMPDDHRDAERNTWVVHGDAASFNSHGGGRWLTSASSSSSATGTRKGMSGSVLAAPRTAEASACGVGGGRGEKRPVVSTGRHGDH